MTTTQPEVRAVKVEHDLIGWCNPRCRRCHRTVIELTAHPAPCRPTTAKAQLPLPFTVEETRPA